MKKILCFFLCVTAVFLCSCNSRKPPEIKETFEADVILRFTAQSGREYLLEGSIKGDFNRRTCEFIVETPDELSSFSCKWGGEFTLSFDSLSCRSTSSRLPDDAPAEILYRVLCHLAEGSQCKGKKDALWEFEGCTEGLCYKAYIDDSGYIKRIFAEKPDLTAEFDYDS